MPARTRPARYLLCLRNRGYAASLEVRKVYRALPDEEAGEHAMVRVIDESGEDYLYPEGNFVPVELPRAAARAFAGAR
jgi:hypothetical protein